MRVLVIGATGAVGAPIIRQLHERDHEAIGTSRSSSKFEQMRALGAEPIVLDALNAPAVRNALVATRPDAVIYQATSLASVSDFKHFDRSFSQTNRLRTEGASGLRGSLRTRGSRSRHQLVVASHLRLRSASYDGTRKAALPSRTPRSNMRSMLA